MVRRWLGAPFVLTAGLVLSAGLLTPMGWLTRAAAGVWSVWLAAATCLVAGWLSQALGRWLAGPEYLLHRVCTSMLARMAVALAACMVVYAQGGMLVEGGFVYYVLVFYLITLTVETGVWLGRLAGRSSETPAG